MQPTNPEPYSWSQQAETTILGAMLVEPISLLDALSLLEEDDFALDSHRRIFSGMKRLNKAGCAVDIITLSEDLKSKKELDTIGGAPYLASLSEGLPRKLSIEPYSQIVRDRAAARRGVRVLEEGIRRLSDNAEPSTAVIDDLCTNLVTGRKSSGTWACDLIGPSLQSLDNQGGRVIPTHIPDLDEITNGGMRTKELWIIGALPSRGKSSLLRQLEHGALRAGEAVHTHTAEMPKEEWLLLHTFGLACVPIWKIRRPEFISPQERDQINRAALKVEQWPLLLDDEAGVPIEALVSKSRMTCLSNGVRVIGVDYIQLMKGEGENHRLSIGNIAMRLKQLAKKEDCCVVALSQLSRKGDINVRPTMQDLRESGELEAHADVVLLNYLPVDRATEKFTGEDEIIVAKQRNGPIGSVHCRYNTNNLRFESRYV